MKQRNIGIDVLKCIAAILITNSHMDILYHPYETLATGGAIGDVLFFFCSGFTLFLKPMNNFFNYYKKRINRIYPTVFAWAILNTLLFNKDDNIVNVIIYGGGWFVTCIMIYYAILFVINKTMLNRIYLVGCISLVIVLVWYSLLNRPYDYNMYGRTYFKWGFYFFFILFGAYLGYSQRKLKYNLKYDFVKLAFCTVIFYVILFSTKKSAFMNQIQIVSLIPLLGITFYFYKVANSNIAIKLYNGKISGSVIKTIGGLCLEIYLVQTYLFTDKLNHIFPLNILVVFIMILIMAYILKCVSNIFSQTFKEQEFQWNAVFKLY